MSKNTKIYESPIIFTESAAAEQGFATSTDTIIIDAYEEDGTF